MPNEMDLWPDDIGETDLVPPVSIMREQASLLGRKTNQLIRARVDSSGERDALIHRFILRVPALDYEIELFSISHYVSLYPLSFSWQGGEKELSTSEEFVDYLKKVLQSRDTKKVVHSLLAQVKSERPADKQQIRDEDIPF